MGRRGPLSSLTSPRLNLPHAQCTEAITISPLSEPPPNAAAPAHPPSADDAHMRFFGTAAERSATGVLGGRPRRITEPCIAPIARFTLIALCQEEGDDMVCCCRHTTRI